MLLMMVKSTLDNDEAEGVEYRSAGELVQVLVNNCVGRVDNHILSFYAPLMARLEKTKSTPTKVEFIDTIACGMFYNPLLFVGMLEAQGWLQGILLLWDELVASGAMKRRKDKKMSLLGLSTLLKVLGLAAVRVGVRCRCWTFLQ